MQWTLEVIPVPVSDVDAAIEFYRDRVGFSLDHDVRPNAHMRVVQLTPPGSGCSIVLGVSESAPGTLRGLQLVVNDLESAREQLVSHGVRVSDIVRMAPTDGGSFVFFSDPDGNGWAVQEIKDRR